jgi:ribosomal protein S18 acetylase RimI-like enzyme
MIVPEAIPKILILLFIAMLVFYIYMYKRMAIYMRLAAPLNKLNFGGSEDKMNANIKISPITSWNFERVLAIKAADAMSKGHVTEVCTAMAKAAFIDNYKQFAIYLNGANGALVGSNTTNYTAASTNPYGDADSNGAVIGYLSYGAYKIAENGKKDKSRECIRIYTVVIDDAWRGHGYGAAAMKLAIADIQSQNKDMPIVLTVNKDNGVAIKVYEKLGFEIISSNATIHTMKLVI